jgi:hypothetical protein
MFVGWTHIHQPLTVVIRSIFPQIERIVEKLLAGRTRPPSELLAAWRDERQAASGENCDDPLSS